MENSEAEKDWNAEVTNILANIYRCPEKKSWYSQVAAAYDRTRPRYPAILINRLFKDLVAEEFVCDLTYSVDDYLALLSTLSPYIRLQPEQRGSLFVGLKKVLQNNCGDRLSLSYLSIFQIAQKITDNI